MTGLGEFTNVDGTSKAPGFNLSTGGVIFGADYRVSPNFAIGLTGGYAHTNADLVNNGSLDVNGGTVGAYATAFGGGFYVNTAATGVFNSYDDTPDCSSRYRQRRHQRPRFQRSRCGRL